jgi:hypothetical protein
MTLLDLPSAPPAHPKGKADDWTDEEIALLALLLLSDANRAAALWASLAPPAFRKLLFAVPLDDVRHQVHPVPGLWFDVRTQRYGMEGLAIPPAAILGAVAAARTAAEGQAKAAVAAVYAGDTDISLWQNALADELKLLALAIHAAGVGGLDRLTGDDLVFVSEGLRFHFERLSRFARQIERGLVTAEAAIRRAALYPMSIVTSGFDGARVVSHTAAGFTLERNVLDRLADHCTGGTPELPDCPSLTRMGWVKIGTMPKPGDRVCRFHCRCYLQFLR